MMSSDDIKLRVGFRVLKVSKADVSKIKKNFIDKRIEYGVWHKDDSYHTVLYPFKDDVDIDLVFCLREALSNYYCDIFISLLSPYDTRIIDVPDYVIDVLKKVDCQLRFSYTIC